MTLLVVLSLSPLRTHYYETFYLLHVILVPLTLIFSALHFPQIWHWCWVALGLWGAERLWRWARGAWVNGAIGPWGSFGARVGNASGSLGEKTESWEMGVRRPANNSESTFQDDKQAAVRAADKPDQNELASYFTPVHGPSRESVDIAGGKERPLSTTSMASDESAMPRSSIAELIPLKTGTHQDASAYGPVQVVSPTRPLVRDSHVPEGRHAMSVLPPPGYAHCVILPGRTVRLTIVTARPIKWAPGQHVLLCVPGISKFTTHPFTIAGACDEASTGVGARGREIVLIVRARNGFTRMLWEEVTRGSGHHAQTSGGKQRRGVLLRTSVDGPFGSAAREDWGRYSTALLVAGGSGVAFALSVLEALCLRLVDGGPNLKTKRIRFVWMIREYGVSF